MNATTARHGLEAAIEGVSVSAYTVPTDAPESDGTAEWDSTTIVVVEVKAGTATGIGYTYAPAAAGKLVEEKLAEINGAGINKKLDVQCTKCDHEWTTEVEFDPTSFFGNGS